MFPRDRPDGFRGKKKQGSEAGRSGERAKKKTEQPVARDCWSAPRRGRKKGGGTGKKVKGAARMQFFSIRRKQRAVDKICIILRRAVPVR